MKAFLFILSFIVVFIIFQSFGDQWFLGLTTIKTLFSLSISLIICLVVFGMVDTIFPEKEQ